MLFFTAGFVGNARAQDEYWFTGTWSACDTTCGEGLQTREVFCCLPPSCASIVPDAQCATLGPRPTDTQPCTATNSCVYTWQTGPWGECSAECDGGLMIREVTCFETVTATVVDEALCDVGSRPPGEQTCNEDACVSVFIYEIGEWGECSALCFDLPGTQTRELNCIWYPSGEYVDLDCCINTNSEYPETTQSCESEIPCEQGHWEAGEWGECHGCDSDGLRTREVTCVDPNPEDGSELLYCDPQTSPTIQESRYSGQTCEDNPGPDSSDGCSCAASPRGAAPAVLWLFAGLLFLLRRRPEGPQ
jgi:MYXO-CTERM domain-containing protein